MKNKHLKKLSLRKGVIVNLTDYNTRKILGGSLYTDNLESCLGSSCRASVCGGCHPHPTNIDCETVRSFCC